MQHGNYAIHIMVGLGRLKMQAVGSALPPRCIRDPIPEPPIVSIRPNFIVTARTCPKPATIGQITSMFTIPAQALHMIEERDFVVLPDIGDTVFRVGIVRLAGRTHQSNVS